MGGVRGTMLNENLRRAQYVIARHNLLLLHFLFKRSIRLLLLQAIEAKEGLEVRPVAPTMGSITFQCFFKYYERLSGMTVRTDRQTDRQCFFKYYERLSWMMVRKNR
jgi:preprotein translocase subunit SecA